MYIPATWETRSQWAGLMSGTEVGKRPGVALEAKGFHMLLLLNRTLTAGRPASLPAGNGRQEGQEPQRRLHACRTK